MDPLLVIQAGLRDSMNPCSLSMLVVFAILLPVLDTSRRNIFWIASIFLGSVFFARLVNLIGFLDPWLGSKGAQGAVWLAQIILGGAMLLLGILSGRDWWDYKIREDRRRFIIPWPVVGIKSGWTITIAAALLGVLMTMASTIWPPDYQLSVVFYNTIVIGKFWEGIRWFVLYTLISLLPLFVALTVFMVGGRSAQIRNFVSQNTGTMKMISSAVLLATGAGLLKIFLF